MYERVLAGRRSEFVVTLDEALFGVKDVKGERNICYIAKGGEIPEELGRATRELL